LNAITAKFERRVLSANTLLCVGLDPVLEKMPERFRSDMHPLFAFNKYIIESTAQYAAAFKPNSAFYECFGASGMEQLALTAEYLHEFYPDILSICDAKRGDNANTNEAYATAVFDTLGFDAVTLHPYLGQEAMTPFLARKDKACIFLCRTSNTGAAEFQDLIVDGQPLWQIGLLISSSRDILYAHDPAAAAKHTIDLINEARKAHHAAY
jgi:orotidine-5'-phosphate decarboxylase